MADAQGRYWFKNDIGRVAGPFSLDQIEKLAARLRVAVAVSSDGENFAELSTFAELVELFDPNRLTEVKAPEGEKPLPPVQKPSETGAPAAAAAEPPPEGPPAKGDLKEQSPVRVFYLIATTAATGRLHVGEDRDGLEIFFRKGTPELVRGAEASGAQGSPGSDNAFGRFLVARKVIAPDQLEAARVVSPNFGGQISGALIGLGLVPPGDVFKLLGEHAAALLDGFFSREEGPFEFDPASAPPPGSFALGQKWTLLCEAVRRLPAEMIRERLGPRFGHVTVRSNASRVDLQDLRLTAQEARAYAAFDGRKSPEELCGEFPQDADAIARAAYLLSEVGHISFVEVERKAAAAAPEADASGLDLFDDVPPAEQPEPPKKEAPAAAKPAPAARPAPAGAKPAAAAPKPAPAAAAKTPAAKPAPAAAAKPPAPAAAKPAAAPAPAAAAPAGVPDDKLEAYLKGLEEKNHYQVLGLDEKAQPAQIKTAYVQMAKVYHPDTVSDPALGEVRKLKEGIFSRIVEAYGVLSDEKQRAEYVELLKSGGKKDEVDVSHIFKAEELFMRASVMIKARKYAEGLEGIEEAIKLNPDEGEFYAWRGYTKFVQAKDKRHVYDDTLAEVKKAIKMSPMCAQAFLFAGQMAKVVGDNNKAMSEFKKCLEIEPKNIEAQRELRILQAQKHK